MGLKNLHKRKISVSGWGSRYLLLSLLPILVFPPLYAQERNILSYSADNVSLSKVFTDLNERYKINYAYDASAFNNLNVTFNIANQPVEELHQLLSHKYRLRFRLVEGTWIVVREADFSAEPRIEMVERPVEKLRTVNGYIFDALTGEPLVYCNVFFDGQRGTITNNLGYFQLQTTAKEVSLYITHLGYHRLDTTLLSDLPKPATIKLNPFVIMMDEVRVLQKEKSMLEMGEFSEKIGFNPAQSSSMPRLVNDDLVNMLSVIPGVSFINGMGGGLSIRGGDPSENLVLLDGIPLLETGHLTGNISMLNANFIRQAFVSRGGFDASFGDRSAGLVELSGKSGPLTHPTIDISANLLNTNVVGNMPIARKVNFSGAWRRSFLEEWPNHLSENILKESRVNGVQDLSVDVFPSVFYDDLNLKASFFPSDNHMLTIGYIQGSDFQMLDYEIGEKQLIFQNDRKESFSRGYSFNWSLQSGNWHHNLTAAYNDIFQKSEHNSGRQIVVTPGGNQKPKKNPKAGKKANPNPNANNSNRNKYVTDNDSNRVNELRIDYKSELKKGIFLHQAGFGYTGYNFDYEYFSKRSQGNLPVDSVSKSSRMEIAHLFVQQVATPVKDLKIRWGLRANYNATIGQFYFQPRGGIEYSFADGIKAFYHSGVYRQFLSRAPKVDSFGNMDRIWVLPDSAGKGSVVSQHHILGFKYEKGRLLLNTEVYSRNTEGRQSFYARQYRKGSINRIQYVNYEGREINNGIDVFMQFRQKHLIHQLSWAFSDSKEYLEGFNNNQYFPSLNSYRHQLNINEIFTYKGWNFSVSWNYRTGMPVIIRSGDDRVTSKELDSFSQLDVGLVKTFRTGRFAFTGGASVLNVLNKTNIIGVEYLNISTDTESFSVQSNISSIGFTPVFFIRLQVI